MFLLVYTLCAMFHSAPKYRKTRLLSLTTVILPTLFLIPDQNNHLKPNNHCTGITFTVDAFHDGAAATLYLGFSAFTEDDHDDYYD